MTYEDRVRLFEDNLRFAHYALNRTLKRRVKNEEEDLIQEAYLGLWLAALSYDEAKNVSFVSYAYPVINHRIIQHVIRYETAESRKGQRWNMSIDAILPECDELTLADKLEAPRSIIWAVPLEELLTEREHYIFKRKLNGDNGVDIGRDLGISRQRVAMICSKIADKLRDNYLTI